MSWVRVDDHMADHPKIAGLGAFGPLALALQVRALCYSSRYLTDGFIPADVLPQLLVGFGAWGIETAGVSYGGTELFGIGQNGDEFDWPDIMVRTGLWEQRQGGYVIHDYLTYNPSREEVKQVRDTRREAGRKGGLAKAKQTGSKSLPPSPTPTPSPKDEQTVRSPSVENDAPGVETDAAARLIAVARQAIAQHYPAGPRLTLSYENPDDRTAASKLLAEYGFEWCERQIRAVVERKAQKHPGDPVGSMAYFARALPAIWRRERESELDATMKGLADSKTLAPPVTENPLTWIARQPKDTQRLVAKRAEDRLLKAHGSEEAFERAFPSLADRQRQSERYLRAEAAQAMRNGSGP